MDLWVVAAATGAGYLAKYWPGSGEKDDSSESETRNLVQQIRDRTCPFRRLARRRLGGDVSSEKEDVSDGRFREMDQYGGHSVAGVASTSGSDENMGKYGDYNVLSLSSLPPGMDSFQEKVDGINGKSEYFDNSGSLLHEFGNEETSSFTRFSRSQSLRSRRPSVSIVKPLNSLESCLTAQLHTEHAKTEEYVYSLHPSPSTPTVRPLLVTDGSRIISRVSRDSFDVQFDGGREKLKGENGTCLEENNALWGAPSLQPIGSVELPRKPKQRCGKGRLSSFGSRVSGGSFHLRESPIGMLLFFTGITIGIISTFVANKREVDKLNELLKQTENLVEDLHDELEMKDVLTVKELVNEGYQSQGKNNYSSFNHELSASSSKPESMKYDSQKLDDKKAENPELMRKIEAELEAELERLELNMKASGLERISDFVELDPDFEADVVQGDLKLDVARGQPCGPSDSEQDASGTSTSPTHTANYAVSPWELSVRLHEVIELRLKARIKELETDLQTSQKIMHSLESRDMISQRGFAYSEGGSSSTPESPTLMGEDNDRDRPLVINLSGEALEAYNDTCGKIIRITETDHESASAISNGNHIKEEIPPFDIKLFDAQNQSVSDHDIIEERWSRSLVHDKIGTSEEHASKSRGSNDFGESQSEDEDEAFGKLLIKQIVERSRSGSSVVLNANQMLYSVDDKLISQ